MRRILSPKIKVNNYYSPTYSWISEVFISQNIYLNSIGVLAGAIHSSGSASARIYNSEGKLIAKGSGIIVNNKEYTYSEFESPIELEANVKYYIGVFGYGIAVFNNKNDCPSIEDDIVNITFGLTSYTSTDNIPSSFTSTTGQVSMSFDYNIRDNNYILKQDGKYYSIKPEYYDTNSKKFIPIDFDENNIKDIYNVCFEDLNILTTTMNIKNETFKPIDKLRPHFDIINYEAI